MKRADVTINARADLAVIRLGVEQPMKPRAEVELDPSAARELIRELEQAVDVATGTAVTRTNDDGDPVSWRETVGYSLRAFAPAGAIR